MLRNNSLKKIRESLLMNKAELARMAEGFRTHCILRFDRL